MARYDIYLANALADREKAELIVRRLRALKFKVRYDKKREHTTPTPKDYRDADNSRSVLILWSKEACDTERRDSDWVHAIAHHARSKDGVLIQASLDSAIPDEPFGEDPRHALTGLGPRKLVTGFYDLVDELGQRGGRIDLRDWMALKASDKDGKEIWKENHPSDPLSQTSKPKAKAAPKPVPSVEPESAVAAPVADAPAAFQANLNAPSRPQSPDWQDRIGSFMLAAVGVVILGLLMLSARMGSDIVPPPPTSADGTQLVERCPAGQVPAYLLNQGIRAPLEPGPIIDDTDE